MPKPIIESDVEDEIKTTEKEIEDSEKEIEEPESEVEEDETPKETKKIKKPVKGKGKKEKPKKGAKKIDTSLPTIRYFKLEYGGKRQGRFSGKKPKQAANKALTKIFKAMKKKGDNPVGKKIKFTIVECTRRSKHKKYYYEGVRNELEEPMKVTIGKGKEAKEIEYKYQNIVKKMPEPKEAKKEKKELEKAKRAKKAKKNKHAKKVNKKLTKKTKKTKAKKADKKDKKKKQPKKMTNKKATKHTTKTTKKTTKKTGKK